MCYYLSSHNYTSANTSYFHLITEGIIETSIIIPETKKIKWMELRNLSIIGL